MEISFVDFLVILMVLFTGYLLGLLVENIRWKQRIPYIKKESIKRSRSVLIGQFSEQIAPYFPDFKYSPSEVKFIGKPIDFIVFKGLDNKEPEEIIFLEIKSQNAKLNNVEKKIKQLVKDKKVSWDEYRAK